MQNLLAHHLRDAPVTSCPSDPHRLHGHKDIGLRRHLSRRVFDWRNRFRLRCHRRPHRSMDLRMMNSTLHRKRIQIDLE
jgi:hypothetical protein